jgi:hypothetical protein
MNTEPKCEHQVSAGGKAKLTVEKHKQNQKGLQKLELQPYRMQFVHSLQPCYPVARLNFFKRYITLVIDSKVHYKFTFCKQGMVLFEWACEHILDSKVLIICSVKNAVFWDVTCVTLVRTDVSKECIVSMIRVTRITMSVLTRAIRHNIPEDGILHSHRRGNLYICTENL